LRQVLVEEAVRVVRLPRARKEDEQAALMAGVHVGGVARANVVPIHVPPRVEDAALGVDVALRRLARIRAEGYRREARPGGVEVALSPRAVAREDARAGARDRKRTARAARTGSRRRRAIDIRLPRCPTCAR